MTRGMRRAVVVVVPMLALAGAGCAADVATGTAVSGLAAEEGAERLEEVTGTVPAAVCSTEARTIQTAAEAHRAVEGAYPASADELVGEYLAEPPAHHELSVTAAGELEITPVPGAGCDQG